MSDDPENQEAINQLIEQVRSQVASPLDLLTFARARRLLEPKKPFATGPFYQSEAFLKYLGAGIGTAIAVGFLLSTNVMSNARNAIDLQQADLEITRNTLNTVRHNLQQQEELLLIAQNNLSDATKELESAKHQTEIEQSINADLFQKIKEARAELSELRLRVSEERIVGSALFLCEREKVIHLHNRLSQAYGLETAGRNVEWATIRVHLLRNEALIYNTVVSQSMTKFPNRRSETGEWTTSQESYKLNLAIGYDESLEFIFDRKDLEELLINNTREFACSEKNWCFFSNRECAK